mgnify:CR=1 FL=1
MKILCRILGVAVCFLSVSTSSASAHQNASLYPLRTHGPAAGKPSAQVELVDLKPVQLRPREAQSVTVMLNAAYSQGQMRVQVSAAEPLEVLGEQSTFHFDLAQGGPYSLPLELYLPVPGRHYVNIAVELDSPDTPINFRALSVIVDGGEDSLTAPLLEPPTAASGGRKIHSLPARERVTPAK